MRVSEDKCVCDSVLYGRMCVVNECKSTCWGICLFACDVFKAWVREPKYVCVCANKNSFILFYNVAFRRIDSNGVCLVFKRLAEDLNSPDPARSDSC